MDINAIVDDICCSDSEEDWNNSDEEESFNHEEERFVVDCLARAQEGKLHQNNRLFYHCAWLKVMVKRKSMKMAKVKIKTKKWILPMNMKV